MKSVRRDRMVREECREKNKKITVFILHCSVRRILKFSVTVCRVDKKFFMEFGRWTVVVEASRSTPLTRKKFFSSLGVYCHRRPLVNQLKEEVFCIWWTVGKEEQWIHFFFFFYKSQSSK